MKFNLISNITNGAGLEKDTNLLKALLESFGHAVTCTMFNENNPTFRQHDINIFIEVVTPAWIRFARENILMPNSEWWYPCWDHMLPHVTRVLCKTKACHEIWSRKVGPNRAIMMGFESNDFYRPEVERLPKFLHLAGKSETKNTATVCAAWRDYNLPYPLTVSAFKPEIIQHCRGIQNLTLVERFTDEQAIVALNSHQFHIMPSKNEGYGMAIHEALSCKGIVLTTDAPPMNEFAGIDRLMCIPVASSTPRLLTKFYEVTPGALAATVHKAARLDAGYIQVLGDAARIGFLQEREQFRNEFKKLMATL